MAAKRKRARRSQSDGESASKKPRFGNIQNLAGREAYHPALRLYYPRIENLRSYLLSKVLGTAKRQRQKIALLGKTTPDKSECSVLPSDTQGSAAVAFRESESAAALGSLLDSTLVCSTNPVSVEEQEDHAKDFGTFSQQLPATAGSSLGQGHVSQSEVGVLLLKTHSLPDSKRIRPSANDGIFSLLILQSGFCFIESTGKPSDHHICSVMAISVRVALDI